MKKFTIGKKYNCEEEWNSPSMSQKQKDQWRSYVISKLKEPCPVVDDNTPREELDEWKKEKKTNPPFKV